MEPTPIDVLNIPTVCAPFTGLVWGIAAVIIPLIFIISILTEKARLVKGENPEFHSVIWITVLVIFGMQVYRLIFMKIVALCETIAFSVFSLEKWSEFMTIIKGAQEQYGGLNFFQLTFTNIFANITLALSIIIEEVFNIIRFTFLSCLYVIGPITFAFAIYQPTRCLFKGWLMSTFQISFWIVTLRVLQGVLVSLQLHQMVVSGKVLYSIIISLAVIIITVLAPAFTSKLFSGQNVGLLGSTVIAFSTFVLAKRYQKIAAEKVKQSIQHVTKDTAAGVAQSIRVLASTGSPGLALKTAAGVARGKIKIQDVDELIKKHKQDKKR